MFTGRSGSVFVEVTTPFSWSCCTQGFVCTLRESLAGMRLDFKRDCDTNTILLQLLISPWTWGIFFLAASNILLFHTVHGVLKARILK